ncbi:MAG: endonuclease/exonuclease/phosphatase family protein [Verrucomicrobiota bacterium]|jgi:endonuclease/exonuclease/phosphatase family metal-dependent hydrolase
MKSRAWTLRLALLLPLLTAVHAAGPDSFTVATYNLENYLVVATDTRPVKSASARARVREGIRALGADVLAVEEIGPTNALLELRGALRDEGLDYPYWEHVAGFDTNVFVGVLSRFPIVARHPHTNENFLLEGRRFQVSRGFAEVEIRVAPRYSFTLIAAHLKSRRPLPQADEADLREQEAIRLRAIIDQRLAAQPGINLVVLGDFNDTPDSPPIKAVIGRGRTRLVDTRPTERNGDTDPNPNPRFPPRNVTWTHYYGKEDSYQRIDYVLASPGLAREWDPTGTWVLTLPNWGTASDHRPIRARFFAEDR